LDGPVRAIELARVAVPALFRILDQGFAAILGPVQYVERTNLDTSSTSGTNALVDYRWHYSDLQIGFT
jgi:hypothetical protein